MAIWIIATLAAFFVKGLCGFANTLVFDSILTFGNANINVTPVELLLGYPSNFIMVIKERKSIRKGICLPLSLLVILGSIPGVILLKTTDITIIKILFGIIVIFIGLEMFVREYKTNKTKESRIVLTVIGILSGVLCGLYGVGALLGAYVNRVASDTREFKANICFVFIVENTFRIILYSITGIITIAVIKKALVLIPFSLLGLFLGIKSSSFMDDKLVKKIVIVMLIVSGMALIINNI